MTRVLLVPQATDPVGCLAQRESQLSRLATQDDVDVSRLGSAHCGIRERLAGLSVELDRCAQTGSTLALLTPAAVLADSTLLSLLDGPRSAIGALVSRGQRGHPVATSGAEILAAGTAMHPIADADAGSVGALCIRRDVVAVAAAAVRRTAGLDMSPDWDELDLLDVVLALLVRSAETSEFPISAVRVEPLPGARVDTLMGAEALRAKLASLDERRVAQHSAARGGDGLYSTLVLRRLSARLTPQAIRLGLSPNVVTVVSAVVGLVASGLFATGQYAALIAGALLLQVSILLDCVDGEIARATGRSSAFGAWVDGATDRIKEYAALAGLAIGAGAGEGVWLLAMIGMVVQTTRHMQDFAFDKGVLAQWRSSFRDRRPLTETSQWRRPAAATAGAGDPTSVGAWLRRVAHMPIGERWLVLTIGALCDSPRGALVAYLAATCVAACWSALGAVRRTVAIGRHATSRPLRRRLAAYRDDGWLSAVTRGRSPACAVSWALPVGVTAAEGAVAVGMAATFALDWMPMAFGWLAVVIWHRYDIVYRQAGRLRPIPVGVAVLGGGWSLRIAVLIVAAFCGVLPAALLVGTGWLFAVYVPESIYAGIRTRARSTMVAQRFQRVDA